MALRRLPIPPGGTGTSTLCENRFSACCLRRVFARVTLPLLRPGLFAGFLFALIVSVNEFVVSLFISTRVTEILPVAMFTYVVNYTDPTMAALSTLFIAATFIVVYAADRFVNLSRVFQISEHNR